MAGISGTFMKFMYQGGWVMWVLLFFSIASVAVMVERWLVLRKAKINVNEFLAKIRKSLIVNRSVKDAIKVCEDYKGPVPSILKAGLLKYGQPKEDVEKTIENAALFEMGRMERNLVWLATIANVSPLLGFFGTVAGMIKSFDALAEAGNQKEALAAYRRALTSARDIDQIKGLVETLRKADQPVDLPRELIEAELPRMLGRGPGEAGRAAQVAAFGNLDQDRAAVIDPWRRSTVRSRLGGDPAAAGAAPRRGLRRRGSMVVADVRREQRGKPAVPLAALVHPHLAVPLEDLRLDAIETDRADTAGFLYLAALTIRRIGGVAPGVPRRIK